MKKLLSRASLLVFVVNIIAIALSIVMLLSLKFDSLFVQQSTIGLLVMMNIAFLLFNYSMFIEFYTIDEEKLCIFYSNKKIIINKVNLDKITINQRRFGKKIVIKLNTSQSQKDDEINPRMDAMIVYYLQNKDKIIYLPYDKYFYDDLIKYGYTISD